MSWFILFSTANSECALPVWTSYTFVTFLVQQNVALDVCSLDQDLGLLQQGCDITGGLYLRIPQLQGLLQYLLVMGGGIFYIHYVNCCMLIFPYMAGWCPCLGQGWLTLWRVCVQIACEVQRNSFTCPVLKSKIRSWNLP